jgi:hypothetical protein
LLEQLQSLEQHMPKGAALRAYASSKDLSDAAVRHLGAPELDFLSALTRGNPGLCKVLSEACDPQSMQLTRMLRSAHRVSNPHES